MIRRSSFCLAIGVLSLPACAPQGPARSPESENVGSEGGDVERGAPSPEASEAPAVEPKVVDRGAVESAARPFDVAAAKTGEVVPEEIFYARLASAGAVCVGERHDEVLDHYIELAILRGLIERRPMRGFELGVGFEMVRTADQPALDAFAKERFGVDEVPEKTRWSEEWGFSFEYFRPHFEELRIFGGALPIALGVPRALTRAVAERGVDGLEPKEARQLPVLDLGDVEHRRLFDALMGGHPHGDVEKMYSAQVVWDEAMATTAAKFLTDRAPVRKLLIFAGAAHCHRSAIPARLEHRAKTTAVSVFVSDGQEPAELRAGYDYVVRFR